MQNIFIDLLNISITASYIIIAVILFRLVFRKIPRKFICILWGIAGLRLIMPFKFESIFSLIPSTETIPTNYITRPDAQINSGINLIDIPVNEYLGDRYFEGVTVQSGLKENLIAIISVVWIIGIIAILLYGVFSYLRLKKTVSTAVLLKENVWQSENVSSPFILGFIKPKIYVPFSLGGETAEYVIAHENAHIRRKDHWIKPIGFLILAVYWFNPLVWIAYILLCRDIEAACDERVIASMNGESRQEYASALLDCAVNRRKIEVCPLAFGEVGVKERIKGVMNYKKPAFWIVVFAVIACVVAAVCFLTSPAKQKPDNNMGMGYLLKVEVEHYKGTTQLPYKTDKFAIEPKEGKKLGLSGFTEFEVAQTDLQTGKLTLEFNDKVYLGDNQTDTVGVELGKEETVWLTDRQTAVVLNFEKTQTIEEAISHAILEHNKGRYMKGTFACESHQWIQASDEENYDEKTGVTSFTTTIYLMAEYSEYVCFGGNPKRVSGGSTPIALTFDYDFNEGKYNLVEYWEADMGASYASSIEDKFPWQAAGRVLNEVNIEDLGKNCDKQAQVYFSQATEKAFAYCDIPTVSVIFKGLVTDGHMPCIEYEIFNYGDKEISYDVGYSLYKYENGSWISLGPIFFNLWDVTDSNGIRIKPEESKIVKYGIDKSHISQDGHYRFETKIKSHTASPAVEGAITIDFSVGDTRIHTETLPEELTTKSVSISDLNCVSRYCYVNYVENGASVVFENSEVPVHVGDDSAELYALFETKEGFDKFYNETSGIFTYNQSYDEISSFNNLKSMYDENFFKNNHLIIVYLPEGSGSVRHKTESVSVVDGQKLNIAIGRIRPQVGTMDMAGWFVLIEIPRNELKNIDAVTVRVDDVKMVIEPSTDFKKTDGSVTYTFTASTAEYKKPYINLKKDGTFYFYSSPLDEHEFSGVYSKNNNIIILKAENGNVFVFKENGDNLIFDASASSPLPTYTNSENTVLTSGIENGSVFEKK